MVIAMELTIGIVLIGVLVAVWSRPVGPTGADQCRRGEDRDRHWYPDPK